MKAGYVQFEPMLRDPAGNRARMETLLRTVEADLVVLPELANSGYNFTTMGDLELAAEETYDGETIRLWQRLAAKRRMTIVGGFAERAEEAFYNSAAVVTPDGRVEVYRKLHLFGKEAGFFVPGGQPPRGCDVPGARIGVMICFDWIFPEVARLLALDGVEVICHPSNIVTPFPPQAMVVRGVENRVFTITANRTGVENGAAGRLRFRGHSQISAPDGRILAASDEESEEVCLAGLDLALARDKRLAGYTDIFASRRPEMYRRLVERQA